MSYLKQTVWYGLLTIGVILAGVLLVKFTKTDELPQPKTAKVYPEFRAIPEFTLQHGDSAFTRADLTGKWSFLFFGYTYCPDVCPTTMAALREFFAQLPKEYQANTQVILVSVDPERDNPEQLAQYATAFHPDFIGITAEHDILQPFGLSFGAIYAKVGDDPNDYLVDHTAKIFLVNPKGERHAIFDKELKSPTEGFEFNIPVMVSDYQIIRDAYQR